MLTVTEFSKMMAIKRARKTMEGLSDRQIITKADALTRSTDERDRLQAIAIMSILMGDPEKTFRKACKSYSKATSEHIRYYPKERRKVWQVSTECR